jgi:drug/metabolite transporter (DMT)-like permease
MPLLLLVSLLWAFSPGLLQHVLGDLPAPAVAAVRLGLTFAVFAGFLRPARLTSSSRLWLMGIGAIQFGVMYLLYLQAFRHLQSHEVFLFTILTPLYVLLLEGALDNHLAPRHALAAVLAVIGASIILPRGVGTADVMIGFLLVQGANLCFAVGQVAYRRTRPTLPKVSDAELFAWLALGAFITTLLVAIPATDWIAFTPTLGQWLTLGLLGVVSSGAGFFLWNSALTYVNPGTLAVLNNAKIPLGVAVSLIAFNETAPLPRLLASLALLATAIWLAENQAPKPRPA